MSIRADVNTLTALRAEMKNLRERMKGLRVKEAEVTARIAEYLKVKDTPGLKDNGVAIILEQKETTGRKKAKEGDNDVMSILERYGIRDTEKVLKEITEARKGEKVLKEKLKIQKYKKSVE